MGVGALLATLLVTYGVPLQDASASGRSVAEARSGGRFDPVLVQQTLSAINGPHGQGITGPRELTVQLPHPTTAGDLLVAGIDDGVMTSGMPHPRYGFSDWSLGATTIGGETAGNGSGGYATGGLQGAIYFYPDNPGGIRKVRVASIPSRTVTWVTVTIAEFADVSGNLSVDVGGVETSGRSDHTYDQVSSVSTSSPTSHAPDLAIALFNNGGAAPHGEQFVTTHGWTTIGADPSLNGIDQPLLMNYRVVTKPVRVKETERYLGGYPIDNCAVIVALR